ncbi:sialomucin core protein 24 isoform X2 [Monodelphis domestica]|uniref:sialomucin core protein 24 isoform X2 n=1 Tax=Monodelphis domestica TaxID=13616 RepID=UPI00044366EC|nr:sialomucin core protein 24 isoform X2 [Monodelphis domestica]
MNGMQGPSRPLLWAAAACLAAFCVLSAAQETTSPTANFTESSIDPPTSKPSPETTTHHGPETTTHHGPETTTHHGPEPTTNATEPTTTQAPAPDICGEHTNCSSCVDSKNATCFWIICHDSGICSGNETAPNCTVVSNTSNCLEPTARPSPISPTAKPSPRVSTVTAVTTIFTSGTPNTTVTPSPSTKKSTFDAASFIGGIVLVLSVQAVVFFLYKFCKSKERNYHTL